MDKHKNKVIPEINTSSSRLKCLKMKRWKQEKKLKLEKICKFKLNSEDEFESNFKLNFCKEG